MWCDEFSRLALFSIVKDCFNQNENQVYSWYVLAKNNTIQTA